MADDKLKMNQNMILVEATKSLVERASLMETSDSTVYIHYLKSLTYVSQVSWFPTALLCNLEYVKETLSLAILVLISMSNSCRVFGFLWNHQGGPTLPFISQALR
jgi:hypothetical protein